MPILSSHTILSSRADAELVDEPEADTDLVDEPEADAELFDEPEADADLVDELEAHADLVDEPDGEIGAELEVHLVEDHEVDEDGSSASAPYLARQMSCLGSRAPGVKDTPF